MTSRSILWLVLGTAALPLIVEGMGGCSFKPGTFAPADDNAYTCSCSCNGTTQTVTRPIAAASDDAEQNGLDVPADPGGNDLDLGLLIVGLRFVNLGIPPRAKIQSAFVQFTARFTENPQTDLTIVGQLATDAATFAAVNNDISGRPATTASVDWSPGAWTADQALDPEKTPNIAAVIQELVDQEEWKTSSPIVLRFQGTGQRSPIAYDLNPNKAAKLIVTYDPDIRIDLPVCATPAIDALNDGPIPPTAADTDCRDRVATTLAGLSTECGYPSDCSCSLLILNVVDQSFDRTVCDTECAEELVDTDPMTKCSNFNPNAYWSCIQAGGSEASCAHHVSATNAMDDQKVCTAFAGAPAMAARLFGRTSTCEVDGTSHIEVGDREPTKDPHTEGTISILGDPCVGGGCKITAAFGLAMAPITFEVRFAPDPMFSDLSASADSLSPSTLSGVEAVFAADAVAGTGNGRRSSSGKKIDSSNDEPLTLGVDWAAGLCDLNGNLAGDVDGENGLCAGDGETPCDVDSPDCDTAGGPCTFEELMTVDVALAGALVNQPPTATAGQPQSIECTSTAGASFTLQGTATDPDENIAVTSWRAGGRVGTLLGAGPSITQSLGVGGAQTYFWRVLDAGGAGDEKSTTVEVKDTVAPTLTLSVSPTSMSPPNHKLVLITATLSSTDTCDATPTIRLVSIASNEPDNGLGDGDQPNDVQGAVFGTDDRQFLLRSERAGKKRDRVYTITYSATDDSGNTTQKQATVKVPAL